MGENSSIDAADIAALTKNNDYGGSWAVVLILLFAMIFGFGNQRQPMMVPQQSQNSVLDSTLAAAAAQGGYVTQSDLTSQLNLQTIQQGQRDITANVNAIEQRLTANQTDIRTQQAVANEKLTACCAEIQANSNANAQKVLDAIAQGKIEQLQQANAQQAQRISQLEQQMANGAQFAQINNRLNMVPTYPNQFVYSAGQSPYCNCNCAQG